MLNSVATLSFGYAADHREAVPRVRPVVEEREYAEALRADEALRTDDRDAVPLLDRLAADVLRVDLRMAVGPHADERIGLVDRMLLGDAVDRRRGNLHHAVAAELAARGEHVAASVDLGRVDVVLGVERKRRRAVHHDVASLDALLDRRDVAYVAERELKPALALLRILEVGYVENANFLHALRAEETD